MSNAHKSPSSITPLGLRHADCFKARAYFESKGQLDNLTQRYPGAEFRDAQVLGHAPPLEGVTLEELGVKLNDVPDAYFISKQEALEALAPLLTYRTARKVPLDKLGAPNMAVCALFEKEVKWSKLCAALYLNRRYAMITRGSQVIVCDRATGTFYDVKSFHALLAGDTCLIAKMHKGKKVFVEEHVSWVWVKDPGRMIYDGVGMYPKDTNRFGRPYLEDRRTRRNYNMWRGYAFEPKKGSWRQMKRHIREVICNRDKRLFKYVIRYLAALLQRPWEKPRIALVLYSPEFQIGKGLFANAIRDTIGKHACSIINEAHLIGKHANDAAYLLIVVEEALFSGNEKHQNLVKGKITEPTTMVELKFRDIVEVDSYTAYFFLSNDDNAVAANPNRFCVLRVNPERQNDFAYFDAILKELKSGGYEAMLHDLLRVDLSGFNVRDVPITAALGDMVLATLKKPDKGILEIVRTGEVKARDYKGDVIAQAVPLNCDAVTRVDKELVFNALSRDFAEYGLQRGRETAIGKKLLDLGLIEKGTRKRSTKAGVYVFRPLDEIRTTLAAQWYTSPEALGHGETGMRAEDRKPSGVLLAALEEYEDMIEELAGSTDASSETVKKHRKAAKKFRMHAEQLMAEEFVASGRPN
jgi:hypothetical protein